MKISLSTNWCNTWLNSGEAIVDQALALGFNELELGYNTTLEQVPGFKRRLDEMPVGSVHSFCPVPISAPSGSPELYQLVSLNDNAGAIARAHTIRNIEFAAEIGADTLVMHCGRAPVNNWLGFVSKSARKRNGLKLMDVFRKQMEVIIPTLEKYHVTLGMENMPYPQGFPDENESDIILKEFSGAPLGVWYDTGHQKVRESNKWIDPGWMPKVVGMHLNDVHDFADEHLAPGMANVDFKALKPMLLNSPHVVFEPNSKITEFELRNGIEFIHEAVS